MKFCKNLQRVAELSDPEWAPYWTNYKLLKKLIKALPFLDFDKRVRRSSLTPPAQAVGGAHNIVEALSRLPRRRQQPPPAPAPAPARPLTQRKRLPAIVQRLGERPGEVAFFSLLRSEIEKATRFFEKAQEQVQIRVDRVNVGLKVLRRQEYGSRIAKSRWPLLARSIFNLYRDLLLLENFAIMTYFSFSKILKKHDKVTGYQTRRPFMVNVVNHASFTHYPQILDMISLCQELYEYASQRSTQGLFDDEILFIEAINRWQSQMPEAESPEGATAAWDSFQETEDPRSAINRMRQERRDASHLGRRQTSRTRRRSDESKMSARETKRQRLR